MTMFNTVVNGYANMWEKCVIDPKDKGTVDVVVERIMNQKARFVEASQMTGAPWWWIAGIIYREADLDLRCYLGNGEKLNHVTTLVPKGRGPFASFALGCVDALTIQQVNGVPLINLPSEAWTIEFALFAAEELNGEGYGLHNENSPYVWAGTNLEQPGMFTSDHGYDATARDTRLGMAAIIIGLMAVDSTVRPSRSQRIVHMPTGPSGAIAGAPVPTGGAIVHKPILSLPNGPNIILEIEHGLDSTLNMLPTIAMFFPPAAVALPFIPLIRLLLAAVEDAQSSGDVVGTMENRMGDIVVEVQKIIHK